MRVSRNSQVTLICDDGWNKRVATRKRGKRIKGWKITKLKKKIKEEKSWAARAEDDCARQ
jgi:hypothetical protein